MGIAYNPKIVTENLFFLLDGANSILPRVGNTALTAAEIQQNFNALRGRFGL